MPKLFDAGTAFTTFDYGWRMVNKLGECLVLSQDYELFFGNSGSIDKCMLEPSAALQKFSKKSGVRITFFVDAGMLVWLDRHCDADSLFRKTALAIRRDIAQLSSDGHEIALHVHPHWEDTRWSGDSWDFSATRYSLAEFSESETLDIVCRYTNALAEISGVQPSSYRAGGFCIEPFERVRTALAQNDIFIDSSVVPGASLDDEAKGFDFSTAPNSEWWFFDDSPSIAVDGGRFLEIPIGTFQVPGSYYWGRLYDRLRGRRSFPVFGDGNSKTIAKTEVMRRLLGRSRIAELSIDEPKATFLSHVAESAPPRSVWSVMGHPKLLSSRSLDLLEAFIEARKIDQFSTVSECGFAILAARSESRNVTARDARSS